MPDGTDAGAHHPPGVVVCVGLLTRDTIVPMPAWPEPDGRLVVDEILRSGGGPAATAAVAVARLGGSAAFVGAVGDDGDELVRALTDEGVDTAGVVRLRGASPESVILLDRSTGTRSILHVPGAALRELPTDAHDRCRTAAWVHVDHAGYRVAHALDRGRLSVDAGNPVVDLSLDGQGLYVPTATALAARYPGRMPRAAVAAALADGAQRVVVTEGARGAIAADRHGAWRVGGYEVDVVSTLGAGDVFHGALLAALTRGHDLAQATRRANVAAALSCRALDGRRAVPTLPELEAAVAGTPDPEPILLQETA
jgi:sugar/nucleoside kinase (ribokinase family)